MFYMYKLVNKRSDTDVGNTQSARVNHVFLFLQASNTREELAPLRERWESERGRDDAVRTRYIDI